MADGKAHVAWQQHVSCCHHNYTLNFHTTFDKMYHSSVVPIIDYQSGIWGYKQYGDGDNNSVQGHKIFSRSAFKSFIVST